MDVTDWLDLIRELPPEGWRIVDDTIRSAEGECPLAAISNVVLGERKYYGAWALAIKDAFDIDGSDPATNSARIIVAAADNKWTMSPFRQAMLDHFNLKEQS